MRCAPGSYCPADDCAQLIADSAWTGAVTHYAPTCQWSCIMVNAVIAQFLNGNEPDICALLHAAQDDGCPDLLAISHRDGIPADVLESIATGETPPAGNEWLLRRHGLIGHTLLAMQFASGRRHS